MEFGITDFKFIKFRLFFNRVIKSNYIASIFLLNVAFINNNNFFLFLLLIFSLFKLILLLLMHFFIKISRCFNFFRILNIFFKGWMFNNFFNSYSLLRINNKHSTQKLISILLNGALYFYFLQAFFVIELLKLE